MEITLFADLNACCTIEVATPSITEEERQAQSRMDDAAAVHWPKWVKMGHVRKIRGLKCYEMVRQFIVDCFPSIEVARRVQGMGEMTEYPLSTVRQYIEHFKATVPKSLIVKAQEPGVYQQAKLQFTQEINTINDMNKLKNMMFERLEMTLQREKSMGFPLPNVERQYSVAMEIVQSLHEMVQKSANPELTESGRPAPDPTQHMAGVDWDAAYDTAGLNKTMQDPASRMRVVKFVENTLDYFGKVPDEERARLLEIAKKKRENG